MAISENFKVKSEQACLAAEEFSKLFYEHFDKKRDLIRKLYLESANVVWNGNTLSGSQEILKYFETLPTSEHKLNSLNCQPLVEPLNPGEMAIAVTVFGNVKYANNKVKAFSENFILTSQANVWKIASDVFRFMEKP